MTSPAPTGGWQPPVVGAPTTGVQVGTTTPSYTQIYVPTSFRSNQGATVPGLGTHGSPNPAPAGAEMGMGGPVLHPSTSTDGTQTTLQMGLYNLMTNLSPGQVQALQEKLIRAHYLNPSDTTFVPGQVSEGDATYYAYGKLMNDAVIKDTGINHILNERMQSGAGSNWWQTYQQKTGQIPTTTTSNQTATNLSSATDARAVAEQEYQSLLGRRPTDQEAAAFHSALNAFQSANPSTSTSTTTTNPKTNHSDTTSTSAGGVDAGQYADSNIITQHGKEYAQAQGDQVYDLFASLIGGSA